MLAPIRRAQNYVEGELLRSKLLRWLRHLIFLCLGVAIGLFALRVWQTESGPPLHVWHTYLPTEMTPAEIERANWSSYVAAENVLFDAVRTNVTKKLEPDDRIVLNRYFEGSPVYPPHFRNDWNRSFLLEPAGAPHGAVVLLHGLTDAPYSMRHLARFYQSRGFVALGIRLPGHGTVPAGLDKRRLGRLDGRHAARLARGEAPRSGRAAAYRRLLQRRRARDESGDDALDDPRSPRPDQVVLISPMVGITEFARFAGLAGLPSLFPRFVKAAWLGIVAEFNPFKYNSFPVNGARQSWLLTRALQEQIDRRARNGSLTGLPPILTFQSVLDFTVSTPAVIDRLYALLPANGSELVLADINRDSKLGILLSTASNTALARMLPAATRRYRTVVITNAATGQDGMVARVTERGRPKRATFRSGRLSGKRLLAVARRPALSPGDSLYGMDPDPADEDFGVHFGTITPRGNARRCVCRWMR